MRFLILIFLLFLGCDKDPVSPPDNPLIRGYVYDNVGDPVENAYIFWGYEITNFISVRPVTFIDFNLEENSIVDMWIENACDEIVLTPINNQSYPAGEHTITISFENSEGLTLPDGLYELYLSINDTVNSQELVLIVHLPENFVENESDGYLQCMNDGVLSCEYAAITNSNGYFEFSQDCLSLGYEYQVMDVWNNYTGINSFSRLWLFADDGENHGTSNYFEVDAIDGAIINIIINR